MSMLAIRFGVIDAAPTGLNMRPSQNLRLVYDQRGWKSRLPIEGKISTIKKCYGTRRVPATAPTG